MPPNLDQISQKIEALTGLTPIVAKAENGVTSTWRFQEFPRPFGFEIILKYELGVARANLTLDNLASPLLASINEFTKTNWHIIESLFLGLDANSVSIQVLNNGNSVTSSNHNFDGTLEIHGRAVSANSSHAATELLSTIISLFGFMAGEQTDLDPMTFREEGAAFHFTARRYERSRFNRNIAIQLHGETCLGCGFNFQEFYGTAGSGVIEVHHLTPVHLMEKVRVVDPRTELAPLCSNCHTLVHQIDPPYTLNQLRDFVGAAALARGVNTAN